VKGPREEWLDREAGPVVRPYAVTKGRTVPAGLAIGLIDLIVVTGRWPPPPGLGLSPEHRQILARCHRACTVVDLASDINLPIGVVRVLLSDLSQHGMLDILGAARGPVKDERLLRDVLHGLQAL
jgi:hypothetical protein